MQGTSTTTPPGHMHIERTCKQSCSIFASPLRSSAFNSSAFSLFMLDITRGWLLRKACSVKVLRTFFWYSIDLNSSVSAHCPVGEVLASSPLSFKRLSICIPCRHETPMLNYNILFIYWGTVAHSVDETTIDLAHKVEQI
jgi:hypothetical protein